MQPTTGRCTASLPLFEYASNAVHARSRQWWLILFSLDVRASSETAFYLIEALKVLVPVLGIGFILVAVIRWHHAVRRQPPLWLAGITAVWLLVTLADRLALSASARHYFISAAMRQHGESFYFALTEWLWTAEQIIILLFGIVLFVALRGEPRQTSNQSLQPTAGRSDV